MKQMQPSNDWYKNNPNFFTKELFKSDLVNEQNINAWVDLTFPNTDESYRKEWHWRAERGTFFINMDDNSLAMWKQLVDSLNDKSFEIDLSISWMFVAKSIMAVVESHAKKSFTKSEARDEVKKQLFHMAQVADDYVAEVKAYADEHPSVGEQDGIPRIVVNNHEG